jgi:hypothetical protein
MNHRARENRTAEVPLRLLLQDRVVDDDGVGEEDGEVKDEEEGRGQFGAVDAKIRTRIS